MFWMYMHYEYCLVSAKMGCRGDMFAIIMALSSMSASSQAEQSLFNSQQLLAWFWYLHHVCVCVSGYVRVSSCDVENFLRVIYLHLNSHGYRNSIESPRKLSIVSTWRHITSYLIESHLPHHLAPASTFKYSTLGRSLLSAARERQANKRATFTRKSTKMPKPSLKLMLLLNMHTGTMYYVQYCMLQSSRKEASPYLSLFEGGLALLV